jgi:hypothetical protein
LPPSNARTVAVIRAAISPPGTGPKDEIRCKERR